MSGTLTVAYSELTRVLPWSLRALGYAFGTADRGAHLVAAGAAMDPAVLDEVCQAGRRPSHRCSYQELGGVLTIDATDISLLETGPVAMDALAARAGGDGWQRCRISGATELSLLPSMLVGAMEYDLCSIGIDVRDGFDWHLAEPGSRGLLYSGHGQESLLGLLAGNQAVLGSADLSPGSVFLIASLSRPELRPSGHVSIQPRERIAAAYRKGIPVSRQTLDAFYALEVLTWAPTSERSRAQAGFTVAAVPNP
jgi:hypothetical protein